MRHTILSLLLALTAITVSGQCRYCNTYEDFLEGRWEPLDTIYCSSHSKSRQILWGGNDYTMKTGNKATDKMLRKNAFAVMISDTLYVNCRNLQYERTRFGNGYTKARRIGKYSLLLVNRIIGREAQNRVITAGFMFGAIGGGISISKQVGQQVCYVISTGADSDGLITIRLIDDGLMDQIIADRDDLQEEYYSEKKRAKRRLATRVIPILEKAGLFEQAEH